MKFEIKGYMIRQIIYQSVTRSLVAVTAVLLWARFSASAAASSWGFFVAAFIFGVLTWFAYLRLDGLNAPKLDRKLFKRKRRRPPFPSGDIADHIDDDPIPFEELEDDEKDRCLLVSNLITAAVCVIAGLLL